MNKLVKGSIAGAAGIALLLGGAGTLALWNASTTVDAGTITAGTLEITDGTDVTNEGWHNSAGKIANINDYRVVPGETLTYVKTVHVKAVGDRISAKLSLDPSSVSITGSNDDLAGLLAGSTLSATIGSTTTTGSVLAFAPTMGQFTGDVTITATIPISHDGTGATDELAMNQSINLSGLRVLLTQVAP